MTRKTPSPKKTAPVKTKSGSDADFVLDALSKSQAIIEFNLDGTVLYANDNFCQALGYSLDDIKGKHHRIFCDEKYTNSQAYKDFWSKLNRGEFDAGEYRRITKTGQDIWIQASYNPVFDKNGKCFKVVKSASDVTKQKLQTAIYQAKVDAINKSQAVIEFTPDGTIVDANDNFLNTLGYSLSEVKGRHHRMFCDPSYTSSQEYRQFWEKLGRGEFDAAQYLRFGKGGKQIWIQASYNPVMNPEGKVISVIKYATDITKEKNRQKEVEEHIKVFEEITNSLSAASEELTASATQMASMSRQTTDQSGTAASAAEQVSAGVHVVSSNTQQMVTSIKEIAKSASESAEMSRFTSGKAQETNTTISQLGNSSKEIGEVIKVISSIAQQTNLLALNATIEAARAADAGKGFAVVANEVKELAKQTAKATQDITNKIGAIQHDSELAVSAIGGITQAIEKLNTISGAIAASVEEQTATTNEVSRVVHESTEGVQGISNSIRLVSKAAEESAVASSQTLEASRGLTTLAERLKNQITKMRAS
ncbi:MAG: PAS domain-containing methyl-accepting chemotaxis protein [Bacteriovoracaceae bacterium]|nr:PAS domain-containing methyl-accepting chemotaxis protein [Bacteriovoracaceae bacterium]